jgi:hypothetical protein
MLSLPSLSSLPSIPSIPSLITKARKLCTPAYIYLVISVFSLIIMIIQNIGNTNTYCVGSYACKANTLGVFVGKILYVAFWTYALSYICKSGYEKVSWFILLLPFISLFIILGLFILNKGVIKV